jgi:hypothetical protein
MKLEPEIIHDKIDALMFNAAISGRRLVFLRNVQDVLRVSLDPVDQDIAAEVMEIFQRNGEVNEIRQGVWQVNEKKSLYFESLLRSAERICIENNKAQTSFIQRTLKIEFYLARAIVEQLQHEEILSPDNTGTRQVLVSVIPQNNSKQNGTFPSLEISSEKTTQRLLEDLNNMIGLSLT